MSYIVIIIAVVIVIYIILSIFNFTRICFIKKGNSLKNSIITELNNKYKSVYDLPDSPTNMLVNYKLSRKYIRFIDFFKLIVPEFKDDNVYNIQCLYNNKVKEIIHLDVSSLRYKIVDDLGENYQSVSVLPNFNYVYDNLDNTLKDKYSRIETILRNYHFSSSKLFSIHDLYDRIVALIILNDLESLGMATMSEFVATYQNKYHEFLSLPTISPIYREDWVSFNDQSYEEYKQYFEKIFLTKKIKQIPVECDGKEEILYDTGKQGIHTLETIEISL